MLKLGLQQFISGETAPDALAAEVDTASSAAWAERGGPLKVSGRVPAARWAPASSRCRSCRLGHRSQAGTGRLRGLLGQAGKAATQWRRCRRADDRHSGCREAANVSGTPQIQQRCPVRAAGSAAVLVFGLYTVVYSAVLSFFDWNGFSRFGIIPFVCEAPGCRFIGLKHFRDFLYANPTIARFFGVPCVTIS